MRYKEARIKNKHEMRGQTKAQVENRSRETAATSVTNMCHVPTPAQLRRACHKYVPTPVIGMDILENSTTLDEGTQVLHIYIGGYNNYISYILENSTTLGEGTQVLHIYIGGYNNYISYILENSTTLGEGTQVLHIYIGGYNIYIIYTRELYHVGRGNTSSTYIHRWL